MAATYDQKAIDLCRSLYLKYGGRNYEAIEREMQKQYPGWRKQNLVRRGRGRDEREGWIERYGFDRSLELHTKLQTESVLNDSQKFYLTIKTVWESLADTVKGSARTKDDLYAFRDYSKLLLDAKDQLDLGRANFETFVEAWELLCVWGEELLSAKAFGELLAISETVLEKARLQYGESEGEDQSFDSGSLG